MSAVERIEVLKDGASAIYGSDAIAGVVNVITRKRFNGAEAGVYVGQYGEGDGQTNQYSMTLGSEGERGGVTLSAEYAKSDPVWAKNRSFSRSGNGGPNYPGSGFSPITERGSWCDPRVWGNCLPSDDENAPLPEWNTLNAGGDPKNADDYNKLTAGEYSNANEQMMVSTGIESKSVYVNGNFDMADAISFHADML